MVGLTMNILKLKLKFFKKGIIKIKKNKKKLALLLFDISTWEVRI
jgi:hypothetical protein